MLSNKVFENNRMDGDEMGRSWTGRGTRPSIGPSGFPDGHEMMSSGRQPENQELMQVRGPVGQ